MAKYTVELGELKRSGTKIFDFDYVFYDEKMKPDFEEKFVNHFYFREIGQETVARFQHYLKCKCDEVLPYYNLLLKTASYEYDIKNNYNLTETYTRTNTTTKESEGNATQNGTTNRDADISSTGNKTNTLGSNTDHAESLTYEKDETLGEKGSLTIDNRNVESDTPRSLLEMEDIKNNVYASKAIIEDNNQTTTSDKTDKSNETTNRTTNDKVNATSTDVSVDSSNENSVETLNNVTNTSQNDSETTTESYTLDRVGDIGVDTTPDKLKKHIEIQKVFTTVYAEFFDQCEDLFMQIY